MHCLVAFPSRLATSEGKKKKGLYVVAHFTNSADERCSKIFPTILQRFPPPAIFSRSSPPSFSRRSKLSSRMPTSPPHGLDNSNVLSRAVTILGAKG